MCSGQAPCGMLWHLFHELTSLNLYPPYIVLLRQTFTLKSRSVFTPDPPFRRKKVLNLLKKIAEKLDNNILWSKIIIIHLLSNLIKVSRHFAELQRPPCEAAFIQTTSLWMLIAPFPNHKYEHKSSDYTILCSTFLCPLRGLQEDVLITINHSSAAASRALTEERPARALSTAHRPFQGINFNVFKRWSCADRARCPLSDKSWLIMYSILY